ncbi:5-amino-6-(5-phospho-D-ribitylamino)uracil phosphatase YigB, partial [Rhizobium leguminosarum]
MHFYRSLGPIRAITFDLDDTLYDNADVIRRTGQESIRFLQEYHPALRDFQADDFQNLRQTLLEREPDIYHDVTEWRRRAVELAMLDRGLSAAESKDGAKAAMENFAHW